MRLENRVAIVTGGARGIGRSIGERFLAEGARVMLADIDAAQLAQTVEELGCKGQTTDVARKALHDNAAAVYHLD